MRWIVLLGVSCALAAAPLAQANADPASDVLITQDVFFPYEGVPDSLARDLTSLTGKAKDAGYPIKVAIIASPDDLGLVSTLFKKPKMYAPFLGRELLFVYRETLIIVMPNGFGLFRGNESVDLDQQLLDRIRIGPGTDGLTRAAITAVRRIALAHGHSIRPGNGGWLTVDRILIAVGALVVLSSLGVFGWMRRRRRGLSVSEEGPQEQEHDDPGEPAHTESEERRAEA